MFVSMICGSYLLKNKAIDKGEFMLMLGVVGVFEFFMEWSIINAILQF